MKKSKSILSSLLLMMIVPLVAVGVFLSVSAWRAVYNTAKHDTKDTLSLAAHSVTDEINLMYPGQITQEGSHVKKGGKDLEEAVEILNAFHKNNQLDIIVYYNGGSILSTEKDSDSEMVIGKPVSETIKYYVCDSGLEYYSDRFKQDGETVSVYAVPWGSDQKGCVLVMQPVSKLTNYANTIALQIVLTVLVTILIAAAVCVIYANNLVKVIQKIKDYIGSMADRDASVKMDEQVLKRRDEIGDIGRSAVTVNGDLGKLINCDPLTELFNRRAGRARLARLMDSQEDVTIVMGDIDYFKQINDTYGHECGDMVLKKVAELIRNQMESRGFAARWGGEEFLLVYKKNREITTDKVHLLLEEIRSTSFEYDGERFHITMTFGIQECAEGLDMDGTIRLADEKLYYGKETGRNRIIADLLQQEKS
ncbi:MAG: diguanylate cyclase [Lachnospiraceae bacterium]|nr:diguanylate cyclase [Lachnospiraceae bacterium]